MKSRALIHGIFRVRKELRQKIRQGLKERNIDISFEMLQVFSILSRQQGLTQQQLAREVVKDKAALTFLLNNMERKGWVLRQTDPADRRSRKIYLSCRGESVMREVRPVLDNFYVSICDMMGKADMEEGILYLERMSEAIGKARI